MKCQLCNSLNVEVFRDGIHGFCHSCGKMVPLLSEESNDKREMQVFFSYGHDNHSQFVSKLAELIEQKTNGRIKVWIDHNRIRSGSNWRKEITDGICNSYAVMAFLSSYSTRERGPCLDELAIAIASKHGMIKSVLLEAEGRFTAPAQTREYQWADMSDYSSYMEQGGDVWEKYLDERSDQIIQMLDSDEVHQYNTDLQLLRKKLHLPEINAELSKFDHLVNKELFGREWLTKEIDEWIKSKNSPRILIVYGNPGSGKSTFAAHLQHYNPLIAASLACDFQSNEFSNEDSIIVWLAYKLAMRIPEYRVLLLRIVSDDEFRMGIGIDRFNKLLLKPLGVCNVSGSHEKMILLIDALDEASGQDLMWFIRDYADDFAPWFRFLITSRKEPQIEACFSGCKTIDIDEFEKENREDICAYLKTTLKGFKCNDSQKNEFIERIVAASECNFAYVECVSENILSDFKKDPTISLIDYPLPIGLQSLFRNSLSRKEFVWFDQNGTQLNYQGFWQKALGVIIASPKPIPIDTLKKMMNWGDNEYQGFRRPLSVMLTEKNSCITVFHKSFADWLNSSNAGEYYTSIVDGEGAFADAAVRMLEDGIRDEFSSIYLLTILNKLGRESDLERISQNRDYVQRLFGLANKLIENSLFDDAVPLCECLMMLFQGAEDETGLCSYREACIKSGSIYFLLNNYQRSLKYHSKALEISTTLMQTHPDNADYRKMTATSLKLLGDINQVTACFEKAYGCYQKSKSILDALITDYPDDLACQIELSNILARIAHLLTIINQDSLTEKSFELIMCLYNESLSIRRKMSEQDPSNLEYRFRITIPQLRMAEVLEALGKYTEAYPIVDECLSIRRRLVKAYPQNPKYKRFLAQALENSIILMNALGKEEEKQIYYKECFSIRNSLVMDFPQSLIYRDDLEHFLKVFKDAGNSQ